MILSLKCTSKGFKNSSQLVLIGNYIENENFTIKCITNGFTIKKPLEIILP